MGRGRNGEEGGQRTAFQARRSPPASATAATQYACPPLAAQCRAVLPRRPSLAVTDAPAARRADTQPRVPAAAALCRGVMACCERRRSEIAAGSCTLRLLRSQLTAAGGVMGVFPPLVSPGARHAPCPLPQQEGAHSTRRD